MICGLLVFLEILVGIGDVDIDLVPATPISSSVEVTACLSLLKKCHLDVGVDAEGHGDAVMRTEIDILQKADVGRSGS